MPSQQLGSPIIMNRLPCPMQNRISGKFLSQMMLDFLPGTILNFLSNAYLPILNTILNAPKDRAIIIVI